MSNLKTQPTQENYLEFLNKIESPQKKTDSLKIVEILAKLVMNHP